MWPSKLHDDNNKTQCLKKLLKRSNGRRKINPGSLAKESWQKLTSMKRPIYYFYSSKLDSLLEIEF